MTGLKSLNSGENPNLCSGRGDVEQELKLVVLGLSMGNGAGLGSFGLCHKVFQISQPAVAESPFLTYTDHSRRFCTSAFLSTA